nr:MAG TPA: hypothetical protein [Caudoviricetes sp.]
MLRLSLSEMAFKFLSPFPLVSSFPRLALYTPEVETPAPAHPDRPHSAGSRADHARHDTHARTLGTLHRSALDTRQPARGRSYRRRALEGGQLLYHAYCDSSITSMVY